MKRAEAEKLLGGHATGTLTGAERRSLFAAALGHQAIFDALMDEEALRELLADPAARAQLLTALAPAPPRVIPFWRRTGVLGAAAGLLVAATAGLAYLRSPEKAPPPLQTEAAQSAPGATAALPTPAPGAATRQAASGTEKTTAPANQPAAPPPPPPAQPTFTTSAAAIAPAGAELRVREQAASRRAEAQDNLAKKVQAQRSAAAIAEVAPAPTATAQERRDAAKGRLAAGVPGGVPGGVRGGVIGGVVGGVVGGMLAPTSAPKAEAEYQDKPDGAPQWLLSTRSDGTTQVEVLARLDAHVSLLRRGPAGVSVVRLEPQAGSPGEVVPWRGTVRLAPGEVLDLYLLKAPATDPKLLPETGPVEGFRARIYPTTK